MRATTSMPSVERRESAAYRRVRELLERGEPVILDGGTATELERSHAGELREADRGLWGTNALYQAPYAVLDVHRSYVEAGCDVISTDTWAILAAAELEVAGPVGSARPRHWMDVARLGVRLARQAIEDAGRGDECAVAFSVNGDVESGDRLHTLALLRRVFEELRPDLVLMETMSLVREGLTEPAVELMLETGLPVWLSFRRCRHGVCGVYGQHWGGPEGDLFGRAARRFEELGVSALLVNCLPTDHVPGMLPWLRDFTDLPLGVYPNLGYFSHAGWRFDERIGPEEYAELALAWREEGAQIVGGCCGTTPAHIAAAARRLSGTEAGRRRADAVAPSLPAEEHYPARPWTDAEGRSLYPLPVPDLSLDEDVFAPTVGSLLVWKHLFGERVGAERRCLDVGCGSGLLTVQLALNGAEHVRAIDIQREAVANTLANAFRNGVAERVSGGEVDLYMFEPEERFDVVVASLYQLPIDPFREPTGHRPVDYWGRNLFDHLLGLLPRLLTDDGRALVMQLSILSQVQTAESLERHGLAGRVLDYGFFPFTALFRENQEQIDRVEAQSDAHHLPLGDDEFMTAYLLEIARA